MHIMHVRNEPLEREKTNVVGKHEIVLEGSFNLPIDTIFIDIHSPLQQWTSLLSPQNNTNFNLTPLQHGRRKVERHSEHDRGFWEIPHASQMSNLQCPDCLPCQPVTFTQAGFSKRPSNGCNSCVQNLLATASFLGAKKHPVVLAANPWLLLGQNSQNVRKAVGIQVFWICWVQLDNPVSFLGVKTSTWAATSGFHNEYSQVEARTHTLSNFNDTSTPPHSTALMELLLCKVTRKKNIPQARPLLLVSKQNPTLTRIFTFWLVHGSHYGTLHTSLVTNVTSAPIPSLGFQDSKPCSAVFSSHCWTNRPVCFSSLCTGCRLIVQWTTSPSRMSNHCFFPQTKPNTLGWKVSWGWVLSTVKVRSQY